MFTDDGSAMVAGGVVAQAAVARAPEGAGRRGGMDGRPLPPSRRQRRCGSPGARGREGCRGEPSHGGAGGGASAAGTARRGAGDGALRDASRSAVADRLRPAAGRDRRCSAAGVVLRGDARLLTPRPRPRLSWRAPGALVRGNGKRLRGVRRCAGGGAARQRPRADPQPRRGQPRGGAESGCMPSRATGAFRFGPVRPTGREPRARTSAASAM